MIIENDIASNPNWTYFCFQFAKKNNKRNLIDCFDLNDGKRIVNIKFCIISYSDKIEFEYILFIRKEILVVFILN